MIETPYLPRLGLFVLAWLAADLLAPLLIRLANRIGAVDTPHTYKIHSRPVPFLGGFVILIAFTVTIVSTLRLTNFENFQPLLAIVLGGLVMALFGVLDDFKPLNAVFKLAILVSLTALLSKFNIVITIFENRYVDVALTLVWMAGLMSAMNSMDNMDGAAAGAGAMAAFWTLIVAVTREPIQQGVHYLSIALLGACIGFLRYNVTPARMFLGNNGAFLIGFLLSSMMVLAGWSSQDRVKAVLIPCSILVVPLYDITLATILRIHAGVVTNPIQAIVYNGRDHLSHRLVKRFGLSRGGAVLFMMLIGFVGGLAGYFFSFEFVTSAVYLPVAGACILILIALGALLAQADVYGAVEKARARGTAADPAAVAREIHFGALVIDAHNDALGRILDDGDTLREEIKKGHMDVPRLQRGGLTAPFFACFVDPKFEARKESAVRVLRMMDALRRQVDGDDRIALAGSAEDIKHLHGRGKIAAVLCIEGGHAIQDDLGLLREFHRAGARYLTLTWNNTNNWADAARGEPLHNGLTVFGRDVVREMNRIGMMVDLSHVSEKTFYDAVEVSTVPVIVSHSCCRALCEHPRNLTDDQWRALARNGGVGCINFYAGFLSPDYAARERDIYAAREPELAKAKSDAEIADIHRRFDAEERKTPRPPLSLLIDHLDHAVRVAGADHVGLGSDFDGVSGLPEGIDDVTSLPKITEGLLARGYGEADIRKILGANVLRVMAASVDSKL